MPYINVRGLQNRSPMLIEIPLLALIEAHQNTFEIKMAAINFHPETDLAPSDPSDLPCLFVGKLEHIKAAGYDGVAKFLGDKVDQKVIFIEILATPRGTLRARLHAIWTA